MLMSNGGAVEAHSGRSAGSVAAKALAGSSSGVSQVFVCLKSLF